MATKTVRLSFEVPEDLDTPSETLAAMKGLLLEALSNLTKSPHLTDYERELCKALLLES